MIINNSYRYYTCSDANYRGCDIDRLRSDHQYFNILDNLYKDNPFRKGYPSFGNGCGCGHGSVSIIYGYNNEGSHPHYISLMVLKNDVWNIYDGRVKCGDIPITPIEYVMDEAHK